jgi:hypothetical protein
MKMRSGLQAGVPAIPGVFLEQSALGVIVFAVTFIMLMLWMIKAKNTTKKFWI